MKLHFVSIVNRFTIVAALIVALVGSAVQVTPVHAASIVVNSDQDTDSVNVDDGKCTLREAIIAANSDLPRGGCAAGFGVVDTITFAGNSTITVGSGGTMLKQLPYITTAVTIAGKGAANTVIQANASPGLATWRLFEVTLGGSLTLDGVTVQNGQCNDSCTSQGNEPNGGGGIYNSGTLTVTNSIIKGNKGSLGGGIYNNGGTVIVTNSTISNNISSLNAEIADGGGGIRSSGTLTVTNSSILGNTASNGGGILNSGTLTVTNSTISGNTATSGGGGIDNYGTVTMTNSTISGGAAGRGVGIRNYGSRVTLRNTIVASNVGWNCHGTITNGGWNLDSSQSCGWGSNLGSMSNTDPKLGPLANNGGLTQTLALLTGSPAINAGDDLSCPATDQRGVTRPQGSHCDIGAYEFVPRTISGNAGVAGATLSYWDSTSQTVIADWSGDYSITVPYGWSGTVTPSLNADAFCPASQSYTNLTTNKTLQHYAHAPCPDFGAIGTWSSSFDLGHGWTVSDFVRTVGDVSGDGREDLVGFGLDGVYVAVSTGTGFNPASKWVTAFDLAHGWTVSQYVRTVGDVSGDGKADLVGFGLDGVYVATSTGSSFNMPSKWATAFDLTHGWTVANYVRTVGDVNGDGKADLIGFGLDGVYVSLSTGSGFPAPSKWASTFDLSHGWTVSQYARMVRDVNGDGKSDLVGFGQDGVYVALSTGYDFGSTYSVNKWTGSFALANGWTMSDYVRTVGDVNGDGKADVVGFGLDGVYIGLSISPAYGFSLPSRGTTSFDLSHGWTVSQYVRTVGDVTGDGKDDLVGFGLDGVYIAVAQ